MHFQPVALLLEPLYHFFGYILHMMYQWLGNYGLVLIVFTLAFKILTLPFSLKQNKMMLKQQFLQDDINEIKRLYAGEPQKQQEAQMQLMKQAGAGQGAGCIAGLVPLILIFGIWPPIRQPLQYIARVSIEHIGQIGQYLLDKSVITEKIFKGISANDIPLISALNGNASALGHVTKEGWLRLDQMINMDFLGLDLGMTPSINPQKLFGAESARYLPLLILPVLTLATMLISMRLMRLNQPRQQSKEEKEREKRNPAKAGQTQDPTAGMMKTMNWMMPGLMLVTSFTLPSALGIFWVVSNLFQIFQSYLSYYLYTRPAQQLLEEQRHSGLGRKKA